MNTSPETTTRQSASSDRRLPKRRRVPTILQVEAVECGAASLAMVLASYGAWLPLEQLRTACGVARDGSKASNIVKAARSFGLAAKGYKKEPGDLADLPWPLILHWNFNHYVVFEGMDKRYAYINDPAQGARRLTLEEFGEAFTGVALSFEKTPEFIRTAPPPGLWTAFSARVAHSRVALIVGMLLSLALILPGIVLPTFSKLFVDGIILRHQAHWLIPLLIAFGATAAVRALLTALRQDLLLRLESKLAIVGASRFMWHILHLPVSFFSQRSPGEIASRVDASLRVAKTMTAEVANATIDLFSLAAFGLILIAYDPVVGVVCVGLALPNYLVLRAARTYQKINAQSLAAEMGKLGAATVGVIANIETIKASGLEKSSFGQWAGRHAKTLNAAANPSGTLISLAPRLFRSVSQVLVLGIGSYRVLTGALTIGDLVALQTLSESFADPVNRLVSLSSTMNAARADLHRVDDALRNPGDPMTRSGADDGTEPPVLRGELRLEDVSYGYNPLDKPLLSEVDLLVRPGERIALVGRSGCGKSSLGRLIAGLNQSWSGTIRIDGIAIEDLGQRGRAANIGYVDQEIFLFEGTVRDNLTLWNKDVPEAAIIAALEDAALLDDIMARPGELDAAVEEGGRNFSGGQRQRMEIARALVANPCLLILDEATAALDPQTEQKIDENLRRRGCTCIIIAHRLSTVRDATEIVVMHRGQIIERGTHDDLLAAGGEYASLISTG